MPNMIVRLIALGSLSFAVFGTSSLIAEDDKAPPESPAKQVQPAAEFKINERAAGFAKLPDGVVKVCNNPDGSFKYLVVKASAELDAESDGAQGKMIAQSKTETQCRHDLAKFMDRYITFGKKSDGSYTIVTKGEEIKDAAGNTVTIRHPEGTEAQESKESDAEFAEKIVRKIIILDTFVDNDNTYTLIMGMSQETIDQALGVKKELKPVSDKLDEPKAKGADDDSKAIPKANDDDSKVKPKPKPKKSRN